MTAWQTISWTSDEEDISPHEASLGNSFPPEQNGRHFPDDIFRCLFMNEKFCILIKISLKFGPKGPIDINPGIGYIR